jgi:hypothetical protein
MAVRPEMPAAIYTISGQEREPQLAPELEDIAVDPSV